jgi:hypothetical protein
MSYEDIVAKLGEEEMNFCCWYAERMMKYHNLEGASGTMVLKLVIQTFVPLRREKKLKRAIRMLCQEDKCLGIQETFRQLAETLNKREVKSNG